MLQLSSALLNIPVMSLRTGGQVALAELPIINPNNLKIEGWYCDDHFSKEKLILLTQDIREIVPQGFAVDDHDVLSPPEELIRLQSILELNFALLGKQVITNHRRRVGKVTDYATDTSSLIIQKLYVSQPIYKNITGGNLTIDRSQIIEITDRYVKIRDVDEKVANPLPAALSA